jgi:hypothetical protein
MWKMGFLDKGVQPEEPNLEVERKGAKELTKQPKEAAMVLWDLMPIYFNDEEDEIIEELQICSDYNLRRKRVILKAAPLSPGITTNKKKITYTHVSKHSISDHHASSMEYNIVDHMKKKKIYHL